LHVFGGLVSWSLRCSPSLSLYTLCLDDMEHLDASTLLARVHDLDDFRIDTTRGWADRCFGCLQNVFASTDTMAPNPSPTDALTEASSHEGTSDASGRSDEDLLDAAAHDSSTLGTDVHGTPDTGVGASMEDTAGTQLACTHDVENEASSDDDCSEGASSNNGRPDEGRAEEDVDRIHRLCARFDDMGQRLMDLESKLVPLGYEARVDSCM
jgi:hypothetical protein